MKISVCMITWNEAGIIEKAIASVDGLADEIIVVDTGSSDDTISICEELGCNVILGADRMNKGAARNKAIDGASGSWIVILDADEQIVNPKALRKYIESTDAQSLYVRLAFVDENNQHTLEYSQMRCWKKDAFRYKYRAHEIPLPVNGWGKSEYTDFVWEHRPPKDRIWKSQYTLDRLLLDVSENPTDARPRYYLGRQYFYRGEWLDAIDSFSEYAKLGGSHDLAESYYLVSKCYEQLNQQKKQIQYLYFACSVNPARREWWVSIASIYHQQGKNEIAAGLLKCALEIGIPKTDYYNPYWYGSMPYDLLARCLWKLGRYEEGLPYAQQALSLEPNNERLKTNLLWFQSATGDMDSFYTLYGADIHKNVYRHKAIAKLVEGKKVLDVGCGTGDLFLILQEQGDYDLYGTDISKVALDMAKARGVNAKLINIDSIPEEKFDTIVVSQVLEHVKDDSAFVEMIKNALEDNGLLIVSVPKENNVPSPDHKREYTEKTLKDLLGIIGVPRLHSWKGENNRLLMSVRKK